MAYRLRHDELAKIRRKPSSNSLLVSAITNGFWLHVKDQAGATVVGQVAPHPVDEDLQAVTETDEVHHV